MNNPQRITMTPRAVTVASVAGGALAIGVAAYQPAVAQDLTVKLHADQALPIVRTLRAVTKDTAQPSATTGAAVVRAAPTESK